MKFALFTDLHLGHAGVGRWHNRLLYDEVETTTRAAVAAVNRRRFDAVFVLGDVAEAGTRPQLERARDLLARLRAPWYVLPGNHDRPAAATGDFDRVFREHAMPDYLRLNSAGFIGLRERLQADTDLDRYRLDERRADLALTAAAEDAPRRLFILSHFPLVSERSWATAHAGKDAGCLQGGSAFLARAAGLASGRTVVFCGHQHWHHIVAAPAWIQCATGALLEYPLELRAVEWRADRLAIRAIRAGTLAAQAASLDAAPWVQGRPADRDTVLDLKKRTNSLYKTQT